MLSSETLENYRRMTPSQRLELTFALIHDSAPWLLVGSSDLVDRKFQLIRRENDERNENILRALARAREAA